MKPNTAGRETGLPTGAEPDRERILQTDRPGHAGYSQPEPELGRLPVPRPDPGQTVGTGPCINALLSGSCVYAQDGELPVDYLVPGDRLITRDAGMVTLRDIRMHLLQTECIRMRAGALGQRKSGQILRLLASQQVLVRDRRARLGFGRATAMVAARDLVDNQTILPEGRRLVRVYELDFGEPHVIYADGLEVASYISEEAARNVA
ncbi:Hint domain-containing protein [Mesobacterium pallidum]|uniref:Hint domain-containing protein n=1 Tax=Mesobacterium pallidum TaxID=2872037 RepID=UPI001EE33AD9|nr:Hint domain-containing protein [Mesobacterium pallidum]